MGMKCDDLGVPNTEPMYMTRAQLLGELPLSVLNRLNPSTLTYLQLTQLVKHEREHKREHKRIRIERLLDSAPTNERR